MEFFHFCSCTPSAYDQLKRCTDSCARQGRSYEFSGCRMPDGCRPAQAQIGFWRNGMEYLLYFRPAVAYCGPDPALRAFFSRGSVQNFPSFQALTEQLLSLDRKESAPSPASPDLFQQLNQELQARVLGQDQAVEAAAFKLWSHICKREPIRPLSLIFYGPTCVGKSELGKAVAPALNRCTGQDRYRLVWTELNTFTQPHSVYRLTGAPPGYVGYDDPPVLEAVRRCPYTVFMFDELDKAHPEILKIFMSILDEGRCTARQEDSQGSRELDFRRCIFLFTTNTDLSLGTRRRLGFSAPSPPESTGSPAPANLSGSGGLAQRLFLADESARMALTRSGVLREIAGRFSGLIGFQPLGPEARTAITAKQIASLGREYGLEITQVAPGLAQALTPRGALSLRSSVPMLEGILTPIFLAHVRLARTKAPLRLDGTPEEPFLRPA